MFFQRAGVRENQHCSVSFIFDDGPGWPWRWLGRAPSLLATSFVCALIYTCVWYVEHSSMYASPKPETEAVAMTVSRFFFFFFFKV